MLSLPHEVDRRRRGRFIIASIRKIVENGKISATTPLMRLPKVASTSQMLPSQEVAIVLVSWVTLFVKVDHSATALAPQGAPNGTSRTRMGATPLA